MKANTDELYNKTILMIADADISCGGMPMAIGNEYLAAGLIAGQTAQSSSKAARKQAAQFACRYAQTDPRPTLKVQWSAARQHSATFRAHRADQLANCAQKFGVLRRLRFVSARNVEAARLLIRIKMAASI